MANTKRSEQFELMSINADWSKKALGKSKNVSAMSHADIASALKGYKAGTYGGPMKGLMKGQVAKYSEADLDAFAQTIGK